MYFDIFHIIIVEIRHRFQQAPHQFDEEIVLRQLRYTGMLETVRIRQAGFNVRLTFDEFIHHYRILLPRGLLRFVDFIDFSIVILEDVRHLMLSFLFIHLYYLF